MTKILSDLYIDFSKWRTDVRSLGAVKLKEDEESSLLETCAARLGEFSIRSTEISWNKSVQNADFYKPLLS